MPSIRIRHAVNQIHLADRKKKFSRPGTDPLCEWLLPQMCRFHLRLMGLLWLSPGLLWLSPATIEQRFGCGHWGPEAVAIRKIKPQDTPSARRDENQIRV